MNIKQNLEKDEMLIRINVEKQRINNPDKGQIMSDILDYLRDNLGMSNLSQTHISEVFAMSVSSLNRLFKCFTGRTYIEVLNILRLSRMLALIEEKKMKDRDIGEQIGIIDPHYLSIWFKKMTGISVKEYRNSEL